MVTSSGASATNARASPAAVGVVMAVATAPTGETAASQPKIASSRSIVLPSLNAPPIYSREMRAIARPLAPLPADPSQSNVCGCRQQNGQISNCPRCQATSCPGLDIAQRIPQNSHSALPLLRDLLPPVQSSAAPAKTQRTISCITKGTSQGCLSSASVSAASPAAQWPGASQCSSSPC